MKLHIETLKAFGNNFRLICNVNNSDMPTGATTIIKVSDNGDESDVGHLMNLDKARNYVKEYGYEL